MLISKPCLKPLLYTALSLLKVQLATLPAYEWFVSKYRHDRNACLSTKIQTIHYST